MDRSRNKSGQTGQSSTSSTSTTPSSSTPSHASQPSSANPASSTVSYGGPPPASTISTGSASSIGSGSSIGSSPSIGAGASSMGTSGSYGTGAARPVIQPGSTMSGAASHGVLDAHGSPVSASMGNSMGGSGIGSAGRASGSMGQMSGSGMHGDAQKSDSAQKKVSEGIKGAADKATQQLDQLNLDEVQQSMQKLTQDGQQLMGALNTVLGSARDMVLKSVEQSPYSTLGAAAGIGYVLGGGLSSALTSMGIKVGTRMVVAKVVKDLVQASGINDLLNTETDGLKKSTT